jgi:hypothetical protein
MSASRFSRVSRVSITRTNNNSNPKLLSKEQLENLKLYLDYLKEDNSLQDCLTEIGDLFNADLFYISKDNLKEILNSEDIFSNYIRVSSRSRTLTRIASKASKSLRKNTTPFCDRSIISNLVRKEQLDASSYAQFSIFINSKTCYKSEDFNRVFSKDRILITLPSSEIDKYDKHFFDSFDKNKPFYHFLNTENDFYKKFEEVYKFLITDIFAHLLEMRLIDTNLQTLLESNPELKGSYKKIMDKFIKQKILEFCIAKCSMLNKKNNKNNENNKNFKRIIAVNFGILQIEEFKEKYCNKPKSTSTSTSTSKSKSKSRSQEAWGVSTYKSFEDLKKLREERSKLKYTYIKAKPIEKSSIKINIDLLDTQIKKLEKEIIPIHNRSDNSYDA